MLGKNILDNIKISQKKAEEEYVKILKEELDEFLEKMDSVKKENKELSEKNSKLRERLQSREKDLADRKKQYIQVSEDNKRAYKTLQDVRAKLNKKIQECQDSRFDLKRKEEMISKGTLKIQSLENENSELKTQLQKAQDEAKQSAVENENLGELIISLKMRFNHILIDNNIKDRFRHDEDDQKENESDVEGEEDDGDEMLKNFENGSVVGQGSRKSSLEVDNDQEKSMNTMDLNNNRTTKVRRSEKKKDRKKPKSSQISARRDIPESEEVVMNKKNFNVSEIIKLVEKVEKLEKQLLEANVRKDLFGDLMKAIQNERNPKEKYSSSKMKSSVLDSASVEFEPADLNKTHSEVSEDDD